jgi:hypothetical protein
MATNIELRPIDDIGGDHPPPPRSPAKRFFFFFFATSEASSLGRQIRLSYMAQGIAILSVIIYFIVGAVYYTQAQNFTLLNALYFCLGIGMSFTILNHFLPIY